MDYEIIRYASDARAACDYEALQDTLGAAFSSRFSGVFSQAEDVKRASAEQLERIAEQNGVDISKYNK